MIIKQTNKWISSAVIAIFLVYQTLLVYPTTGFAQGSFILPTPGTMIGVSPSYNPAIVAGITVYPDNPLQFDFIIDTGDDNLQGEELRKESEKLISYFMAVLTVPEDEMWVNLSPYEKERIIADGLGNTVLGRDMLAQDYILKQLTASMMYPEDELGNKFWQRVYEKVQDKFGTSEIPTNTFNKIWIIPEEAVIYANGTSIFVADSRLKVMMEEDYLALEHHDKGLDVFAENPDMTQEVKAILKEILLPEIEKEVNEGKNFAPLRQIYHSMILATWYKNNLKESLLGEVYINQNKIYGVDVDDKNIKNKIYSQYVQAFKLGVYNYIREDYDQTVQEVIPRKYFSGGEDFAKLSDEAMSSKDSVDPSDWLQRRIGNPKVRVRTQVRLEQTTLSGDAATLVKSSNSLFDWTTEESSIANIHQVIKDNVSGFWDQYEDLKKGESLTSIQIRELREKLYAISQGHFKIWGLSSVLSKKYISFFNGSHITALVKSFPELELNPYSFGYRFSADENNTAEENGINSVLAAIERYEPDIMEEYRAFLSDKEAFDKERLKQLKDKIYSIGFAQFSVWKLAAALSRTKAPYFEGTFVVALIKAFSELELNPYAFVYRFNAENGNTAEENGVRSVEAAIERYMPEVLDEYRNYTRNREDFGIKRTRALKEKVYGITKAHFQDWSLSTALNSEYAPYFEGSHIVALIKVLKDLDLNPYAFSYRFIADQNNTPEENGVKSILAAFERYAPEIIDEYRAFLSDREGFSNDRLRRLKENIYSLNSGHLEIWNLATAFNREQVPYFNGSYKVALVMSFPELELDVEEFQRHKAYNPQFIWMDGEEYGKKNILMAFEMFRPDIVQEYRMYVQNPRSFTTKRLRTLMEQIYQINTSHFNAWRLGAATNKITAPYFEGSHIVALVKTFEGLELNPYAFRIRLKADDDNTAVENGIKSIHAAFERRAPEIIEEYRLYLNDREGFGKERLEALKESLYYFDSARFKLLGLDGGILNRDKAPYFEGSYVVTIVKSFEALELNPLAFDYRFIADDIYSAEENGKRSIMAAVERYAPAIVEEYNEFLRDKEGFDQVRLRELRENIYSISSGHFVLWHLSAAMDKVVAPYFEGSYITALVKSFEGLNLNPYAFNYRFKADERGSDLENGINSVHAAFDRHVPEVMAEYRALLEDSDGFGESRLANLRSLLSNVSAGHFSVWGLTTAMTRKNAPYFEGSHKVALRKSFPEVFDDAAMVASEQINEVGGIDFNAGNLNLREQGYVENIKFTNLLNIEPLPVNGVTPIIINITPIANFPYLISKVSNKNQKLSRL